MFGKNRLIATILNLRARYFDLFFSPTHLSDDKTNYETAKDDDIENPDYFHDMARKRAILFYLSSYIIKFNKDESFLNDETFGPMRRMVLDIYRTLSYKEEGRFCGFTWFVIPKILINLKYRMRRLLHKDPYADLEENEEE